MLLSQMPQRRSPPKLAEARPAPFDVRDALFAPLRGREFPFAITVTQPCVLAGVKKLATRAEEVRVGVGFLLPDGSRAQAGALVCSGLADAWGIARAEEQLMSAVGKASGVATAAAGLVAIAGSRARIVSGAWKKVAPELRADLRDALAVGGAAVRILDRPFVYLDKNYIRMLGGVDCAVRAGAILSGRAVVVQLRGETAGIREEAAAAAGEGADVLMVDTGEIADLAAVAEDKAAGRLPKRVVIAFGGSVTAARLPAVLDAGAEIVDVGRAILDAPMIDFRFDVRLP